MSLPTKKYPESAQNQTACESPASAAEPAKKFVAAWMGPLQLRGMGVAVTNQWRMQNK
jgi:hypothetical protein